VNTASCTLRDNNRSIRLGAIHQWRYCCYSRTLLGVFHSRPFNAFLHSFITYYSYYSCPLSSNSIPQKHLSRLARQFLVHSYPSSCQSSWPIHIKSFLLTHHHPKSLLPLLIHTKHQATIMHILFSSTNASTMREKVLWIDEYVSRAESGLLTPSYQSLGSKTYIPSGA
jgi:hypothetical protein